MAVFSLNNLKTTINQLVNSHYQLGIGHFTFAQFTKEATILNILMPHVWMDVTNITFDNQTMTYEVKLICMDISGIKENESILGSIGNNETEILNDTMLILNDIYNVIKNDKSLGFIELEQGSLVSFRERFDDWTTGWEMTLNITTQMNQSLCKVPYGGVYKVDVDINAYQSGYTNGFSYGYQSGYTAGGNYGYITGYTAGFSSGYTDGSVYGFTSGYTDGSMFGFNSGYSYGYGIGYTDGFSSGQTYGFSLGFASGYTYADQTFVSSFDGGWF